jgi:uncharacterized membrane protein (UPF0127 family)
MAFRVGAIAFVGASFIAIACQKSPPEPEPIASSAAVVATTTDAKPKRCVRPSPATASPTPPPAFDCPKDDEPNAPPLPTTTLRIGEPAFALEVEMAATPHQEERGLMFRRQMPENHGMLFHMADRKEHVFWMHNTCMPLDMLFIDDDGFIVGIEENVPTLNDAERTVGCFSRWVLEVNAGWSRRHGVKPGQSIDVPSTK